MTSFVVSNLKNYYMRGLNLVKLGTSMIIVCHKSNLRKNGGNGRDLKRAATIDTPLKPS
jgi:hypothetical protein